MVRYLNMLLDNYSILQPLFLQSKILELVKTKISLFFSYLKKKKSWHVEIMACGKLFRLGNKGTDGLPSVERAEKTATLRTSRRRQAIASKERNSACGNNAPASNSPKN
jgi:hypothetical protein